MDGWMDAIFSVFALLARCFYGWRFGGVGVGGKRRGWGGGFNRVASCEMM